MPIWRNTTGNFLWGDPANWDTNTVPTDAGAGSDAIFDAASPACTVNIVATCRNLDFTGYANTITMNNTISVGSASAANPNHSVTLSASLGFSIAGTAGLITKANGTTSLRSNGATWSKSFSINTTPVAVNSTVILLDNWNNGGNVIIGPGSTMTLSGSFNLTCNANLTINVGTATSSSLNSAVALSTIILAGNSTYTANAASVGVNLTINAPGNIVILADGASYGGGGAQPTSTFRYIAGTVVCTGTFYLNFVQTGNNYNVDIKGDPATSATTTNLLGVNFNNLSLKSAGINNSNSCTFVSPVCVVNDLLITSVGTPKAQVSLIGSTIHANKNFTVNGMVRNGSTTTIRLQGTGTWSENNTLSAIAVGFGLGCPVVINTAGTITLGSFVGIRTGSLTLTSGSFITTGFGLRVAQATLNNLGSGGAFIESMYHTSLSPIISPGSAITINDTVPLQIGYLEFNGFNAGNNAHKYLGTAGWVCNNLYYQQTSGAAGADIGLVAESTIEYRVKNSLILRAWNISTLQSVLIKNSGTAPRAIFTLDPGASQDVFYTGGSNIDSSRGQTVWSRKGTLTNTINWSLWTYPKTRFGTFTI